MQFFFLFDETKSFVKNTLIDELTEKLTCDDLDEIGQSNQVFQKSPDIDTPRSKHNVKKVS